MSSSLGYRPSSPSGSPEPEKEKDLVGSAELRPVLSVDDAKAEARLVRFLDLRIMPLMGLAYLLLFLDRSNIGNANAAGLSKDLHLGTYDYNIGGSLYYLFYFLLELPAGLLVKRYGTIIVPASVISFGIVTLCTAWIHNRGSFFTIRVILGIAEGFAMPGISYMLSRYYRRRELTIRLGFYMLFAAGLSQAFGSLLAAGLINLGTVGSVKGWRIIFLVEGIITIGLGVLLAIVWPKDPEDTKLLNEEQRRLAIGRILLDTQGATQATEKTSWKLIWRAIKSPTNVVCVWIFISDNVIMQGLALFTPTVLRTTYPGRTAIQINLLAAPVHIVAATVALISCYCATRFKRHSFAVMFAAVCAITGYAIWLGTTAKQPNVRYGAIYLIAMAGYTAGPTPYGWALSNASPATIRAVTAAMIPGFGCIGSIASPWMFISTTAPSYRPGNITNIALQISCLFAASGLFYYQWSENRKRDQGKRDYRLDEPGAENLGYDHPKFRFIY